MTSVRTKRLIIRLSSLGDVVLATSAFGAFSSGENHWVVASEFADLLKGHPKLARVWEFDRKRARGLGAWLKLCSELWDEDFTEVLDLHNTWRSWVAHIYFSARARLAGRSLIWRTMSKERLRLNGLFLMKRLWPKAWYPSALTQRFAKVAGGAGSERPNLSHLVLPLNQLPSELQDWLASHRDYICVMPSSKWDGKKWSLRGFLEVINRAGLPVVVLGSASDRESVLLAKSLRESSLSHFNGVGRLSFRELATALAKARAYLGNDTGLAHLSEAVGTRVVTVFGPTLPEMGFGPWREESKSVGITLWCKPCGKDGRKCLRFYDRYACQKGLPASLVSEALESVLR